VSATPHRSPSPAQLQAYLENRLSPRERAEVEAMLEASADDREALEGLRALGPEGTAGLTRQVQDDVAQILAAGQSRKRSGRILQMGRLAAAAALVAAFAGAWWLIARLQQPDDHRQAFERHFEPLKLDETSDAQAPGQEAGASDQGVADQEPPPPLPGPANTTAASPAGSPTPAPAQDLSLAEDAEDPYLDGSETSGGWDAAPAATRSQQAPAATRSQQADAFNATESVAEADKNAGAIAEQGEAGAAALPPGEYLADENYPGTVQLSSEERVRDLPKTASRSLQRADRANRKSPASDAAVSAPTTAEIQAPEPAATEDIPRGTGAYKPAPDPYEQGRKAYEAGDYRLATEWLVMVPADHPRGAESSLLQANAWLKRGKPERAEPLLENLLLSGEGPLYDQTRWYLALTRIALGRPDDARPLLRALQAAAPPMGERATELLEELEP
jgi:hypothetical protein